MDFSVAFLLTSPLFILSLTLKTKNCIENSPLTLLLFLDRFFNCHAGSWVVGLFVLACFCIAVAIVSGPWCLLSLTINFRYASFDHGSFVFE